MSESLVSRMTTALRKTKAGRPSLACVRSEWMDLPVGETLLLETA